MGFHMCPYCEPAEVYRFSHLSSGDTTLVFDNGHRYQIPDMILHYVYDHQYLPPTVFVDDVMNQKLLEGERCQTKSIVQPIGYLEGNYPKGCVPLGFVEKLEFLLQQANAMGNRIQYRGS